MLAAETIFDALKAGDTSSKTLSAFPKKIEQSYIKKELWQVRNFHQSFQHGMLRGFFHTAFQQIGGGRRLVDPMRAHAGHETYQKIKRRPAPERFKSRGKGEFALVGQQAVYVELRARADVDLAVSDGRHRELDRVACSVSCSLSAIPQLVGQVRGVVGVQNRRARIGLCRRAVLAGIDCPDDPI